jgi:hypothetical protein
LDSGWHPQRSVSSFSITSQYHDARDSEAGAVMQDDLDVEALKAELASLSAMLVDLELGKIPHGLGNPFEDRDRQAVIWRRIEKIKSKLRGGSAINTERF